MIRTLVFILLLPLYSFAQFTDNFSNGNFTENPEWTGDIENFIVNEDFELQLYDTAKISPSYLVTQNEAVYDAEWEFLVRYGFNPSSANYANVYLVSNTNNLNNPLNGYYIMLGNTSRNVSLYRQDGSSATKIIDGTENRLNTLQVNVRVKVTRDFDGNWTLMSDTLGGTDYYNEGNVFDDTYYRSDYFGIKCVYSTTRWDKFYFDDFIVSGEPYIDSIPPEFLSYQIIDNKNIILEFNEKLQEESALNTGNYIINNNIGNPVQVNFYDENNSSVLLEFENPLQSPENYILQYQNISDIAGNIAPEGFVNFLYLEIVPGMIVINEIMRDATPVVGLPSGNYVELYNTTDFEIDITNWVYEIGIFSRTFPQHIMAPGEYLILCAEEHAEDYSEYGEVMSFESFPAMNNQGQTITIFDENENIIDKVTYSELWYDETWKRGGGWSLEKIDPNNHCSTFENWTASIDPNGGTPGAINSVDAPNLDTIPPVVEMLQITAANEITVYFSERVVAEDIVDISNYEVIPQFGNPINIIEGDNNRAILQFPVAFTPNTEYSLIVQNIRDLCDNILEYQELEFVVFYPEPLDVIITEIMPKPAPVVKLPDAEYVELYNRTDYDIDLTDWIFTASTTSRKLPYSKIKAKSYVILCHENKEHLFSGFNNVIGVPGFPYLANTGTTLSLQFKNENYIHTVTYTDNWVTENFKKEGGWSLEMIDTDNPCGEERNWRESVDSRGGTPGEVNSVAANNPDFTPPYPIAAEAVAPDTVIVWFNEILLKEFVENIENFSVNGFGNPEWISAKAPRFSEIKMKFNADFEVGKVYYLDILNNIKDCSGNTVEANISIRFGLPDSVVKGDLVINEILFNAPTGASKFVEIYNNSDRLLDLKKLWISNRNSDGEIANSRAISDKSRLVLPGEYCVITTDNQSIIDHYFVMNIDAMFEATSLPSFPIREGTVIISDRYFNIIDEVSYNQNQHYRLLGDVKGVSLERINYDRPSSDPGNWHSAAQSVGFATPGYKNSQYIDNVEAESSIKVYPEVFSPNNDGYDDILNIAYKFDEPGYTVTMAVYSSNGRFITYIAQNELVGTEGYFYWGGFDNKDILCPIGIYILYAEMFSLSGNKKTEKHVFVLSKKRY